MTTMMAAGVAEGRGGRRRRHNSIFMAINTYIDCLSRYEGMSACVIIVIAVDSTVRIEHGHHEYQGYRLYID